jgi:hypothetical protein
MLEGYEDESSSPPQQRPQTPCDDLGEGPNTPPMFAHPHTPTDLAMSWTPTRSTHNDDSADDSISTTRYTPGPVESSDKLPLSPQNPAELHRYLAKQRIIGNNNERLINTYSRYVAGSPEKNGAPTSVWGYSTFGQCNLVICIRQDAHKTHQPNHHTQIVPRFRDNQVLPAATMT